MIAIIDYDAGNILSVQKALDYLGQENVLTRDKDILLGADKVILPGVGAFGDAMDKIRSYGLEEVIKAIAAKGTPFLGICLGLQLMFEKSEESPGAKGLCLLPGTIKHIPDGEYKKIPHMGWNSLTFPKKGRLYKGIDEGEYVYFVHSYYLDAADKNIVVAQTDYNVRIDASVEKDNLFACQFHPEKSSEIGLKILSNFVEL